MDPAEHYQRSAEAAEQAEDILATTSRSAEKANALVNLGALHLALARQALLHTYAREQ